MASSCLLLTLLPSPLALLLSLCLRLLPLVSILSPSRHYSLLCGKLLLQRIAIASITLDIGTRRCSCSCYKLFSFSTSRHLVVFLQYKFLFSVCNKVNVHVAAVIVVVRERESAFC